MHRYRHRMRRRGRDLFDHAYSGAPALSPDGSRLYLAYDAFTTGYQATTGTPRRLVGGLLTAPFDAASTVGSLTTVARGVSGDPRGSSQNNLVAEFLGDDVYAVGTRHGGAAVWNDVRGAADCPKVDAYRQAYEDAVRSGSIPPNAQEDNRQGYADAPTTTTGTPPAKPDVYGAPAPCAPSFGNSDIYAASTIAVP